MKNIIYVGAFRFPDGDAAGPRVLNNAKAMRECGYDVKFISWGGSYREEDKCFDGKYKINEFEYVITDEIDIQGSFYDKIKGRLNRGKITISLLETMQVKPDIIIMYNAGYKQTMQMIKYSKKNSLKLVSDITEWYAINEIYMTDWLLHYLNMYFLQKQLTNKIVISEYLNNFYPKTHNIVVPPLCDINDVKWNNTQSKLAYFDGVTLIYAGNPAKKDCVHTSINVVQKLIEEGKKIRFIILGVTKENYIARYQDMLKTTCLDEKIMFLGRVSQELIPIYYKAADFMLLLRKPTIKSMAGFPTKFAESMTAGTPVITNLTSDLNKYLKDGYNGFIVNGDSAESLYFTMKEKVMTLTREEINKMKSYTKNSNRTFDYHNYIELLRTFIDNLH